MSYSNQFAYQFYSNLMLLAKLLPLQLNEVEVK